MFKLKLNKIAEPLDPLSLLGTKFYHKSNRNLIYIIDRYHEGQGYHIKNYGIHYIIETVNDAFRDGSWVRVENKKN